MAQIGEAIMREAQEYIESVLQQPFQGSFHEYLRSGVVLCNLINKIRPGTINQINNRTMPFMQMENIKSYLDACRAMGVPDKDSFVTIDLFEAKDLVQVAQNILMIKRMTGHGFERGVGRSAERQLPFADDQTTSNDISQLVDQPIEIERSLSRTGAGLRPGHSKVDASSGVAPNCISCNRIITAGVINACGATWHPACFNCKKCGTKLAVALYYDIDSKPYCDRCCLYVRTK
eukprot:TRINITY_DN273_c2_g1_i2.p1 TRINITY_DN273_c2_g1~~TRINITY_DN273_c2_g1_i2.p1  ORF type:complete len:233 (+),score=107.26 TRINITY_DN273_c2_g1_i2:220-918(+)